MKDLIKHTIYARENKIFKAIGAFSNTLNINCYVIGGYVRDRLLGIPSKDIDIVVEADGIDFAVEFTKEYGLGVPAIYKRYGTAQFKIDDIEIEIVGARAESYTETSIKPDVRRGTIKDDVLRRDFTINTLMISVNDYATTKHFEVLDLTGQGLEDLKNKSIRTPLDPNITFKDDPSRILRAVRFASKYNFTIEDKTVRGIIDNTFELYRVPVEKVRDEINKILLQDRPALYFKFLKQLGILRVVMPGLDLLFYIKQNPKYHYYDAGQHTLDVLNNVGKKDLITRLAAVYHDFGKIDHTQINEQGEIISYDHQYSKLPEIAMRQLKYDNNTIAKVTQIIETHMGLDLQMGSKGIRRFIRNTGAVLTETLDLIQADVMAHNIPDSMKETYYKLIDTIRGYDVKIIETIKNISSPLSGLEIIKILGFPERPTVKATGSEWNRTYGIKIGQIVKLIVDAIVAGNIDNTKKAATEFVLSLPADFLKV